MKIPIALLLLCGTLCNIHGQEESVHLQLRAALRSNSVELIVDGNATNGALFIYRAEDVMALRSSASVVVQTNTSLTNEMRFSIPRVEFPHRQVFFAAEHWPGLTVEGFGDPEIYPDIQPPEMILFTDGTSDPLTINQAFTVDFFVTDPTGQTLDVSGPAAILLLRQEDGVQHPDAIIAPAIAYLTNGHMQVLVKVQAASSVNGYALGLGPAPAAHASFWEQPMIAANSSINQNLPASANLSRATLAQLRKDNADPGPSWSYPLAGGGHPVSGTFGEWRGENNKSVHLGLDLAAPAASTVVASRGGVVSHIGNLPGMGDYIVVDHGGGWFSRYLHLDGSSVHFGQAVARGAPLATRLYAANKWPQHLHFEVRQGSDQPQWHVGLPGSGRDPLQEPEPFEVAPGSNPPELKEFGLTRRHPGELAFVKSSPSAGSPGPVYLFVKFLDVENTRRLGLRSMNFLPDGATATNLISPRNDAVVNALLPPSNSSSSQQPRGFALYTLNNVGKPPQSDWFCYWWQWDTVLYRDNRIGPRSLLISGTDHNPVTANFPFAFGPLIKGTNLTMISANQFQFTIVAYLGTNAPISMGDAALFVQPDQYKLEIIRPDGNALAGVTWSGPMSGSFTRLFTAHLDEDVYTFTVPASALTERLKLRVSSRLVPDIAHEVCLCGGMNMVFIPAGTFIMGSPPSEAARSSSEGPQTQVTISRGFCMGKYEVTQAEYVAVMGSNPSSFVGDMNRPVEQVSWFDCFAYCAALMTRERNAGRLPSGWVYRLPTEAEWEYACRAGTTSAFHYGDALSSGMANFYGMYEYPPCDSSSYCFNPFGVYLGRTTAVGSYAPNSWGLYDMHGNVWEWCLDGWTPMLPGGTMTDPLGVALESERVVRGAAWNVLAYDCRSAHRYYASKSGRHGDVGFRIVLALGQP